MGHFWGLILEHFSEPILGTHFDEFFGSTFGGYFYVNIVGYFWPFSGLTPGPLLSSSCRRRSRRPLSPFFEIFCGNFEKFWGEIWWPI